MDFKPHAGNKKEIDFYRQELTTQQYVDELIKMSAMFHKFYYKDKLVAIAGVVPNYGYANYWQFLSEDFPDYIPMKFLKEYLVWGNQVLNNYDVTCNVFKENRFAYWLIHHGKTKCNWKVHRVNNPCGSKFFIKKGGA